MAQNLLNRYVWLVDAIGRTGERGITFAELSNQWSRSSLNDRNEELSKRTFHHQKSEIAELFRIDIVCNRRSNRYTIESYDDDRKGLRRWLVDAFTVANAIKESESIPDLVMVEEVPSGHRFLSQWIAAMKQCVCVKMRYRPFWSDGSFELLVEPYFVKLRSRRWYLYAVEVESGKGVQLYALDRIEAVEPTDRAFSLPEGFSAQEHLQHSIGAAVYASIAPRQITIKAYGDKPKYLDTLPLHPSQSKVGDSHYTYYLSPTPEFYQEMLRQGEEIEVVSPPEVRQELLDKLKNIHKQYNR